jgi:hypothetical protein
MEQGLWTAIFSSGSLAGGGVVYLSGGRLVGGDSQFYFAGEYKFDQTSRMLDARATVLPFVAGAITIFGFPVDRYELTLRGTLEPTEASIRGFVTGNPQLTLNVKLVKRLSQQF